MSESTSRGPRCSPFDSRAHASALRNYSDFIATCDTFNSRLQHPPRQSPQISSSVPTRPTHATLLQSPAPPSDQARHQSTLLSVLSRNITANAMPRTRESSPKQAIEPPREASLPGLPAELRNNIYHLVAEDIDEVKIIARKIGFGPAAAEDRFWDTVAKHPLSQTCRQFRQEFDPIHRHTAMTTRVSLYLRYYLEVENYDLDRLGDFARLLQETPSMRRHFIERPYTLQISFCLNQKVKTSVEKFLKDAEYAPGCISYGEQRLSRVLGAGDLTARVNLKLRTNAMSAAEKKIAVSRLHNSYVKEILYKVYDLVVARPKDIYSVDPKIAQWLFVLHRKANKVDRRRRATQERCARKQSSRTPEELAESRNRGRGNA